MMSAHSSRIPELATTHANELLAGWLARQKAATATRLDLISEAELEDESKRFLDAFAIGLASGDFEDIASPGWSDARDFLRDISRSRAT